VDSDGERRGEDTAVTDPRWLDEHEQQAWRRYLDMQAQLQTRLHRELQRESSLSLADFDVLVALTDRPDTRIRVLELAEAVQWEKSRLSHHLVRMQRRGLIERQDCPDDARGAFVVLTDDDGEPSRAPLPPTSRRCAGWCSTGSTPRRCRRWPTSPRSCSAASATAIWA